MKAYVIRRFGDPDVFEAMEVPRPEAGEGQVVIRVAASSVNPIDTKIRSGAVRVGPELPAVLHGDVAGTIEAIGEGVEGLAAGDEVYACAGGVAGHPGALADYMVADAALVAPKPKSLSPVDAAVLPLVSITAWEALIDKADVQPGQRVLIHGGTGGVGHVGVQLAKWRGATVCATCGSEEKMAAAKALGADAVIHYKTTPVQDYVAQYTDGRGFDVVFDTVGGEVLDQSVQAARLNGTVVNIAGRGTIDLPAAFMKAVSLHLVMMLIPLLHGIGREHHGKILRDIARIVDDGKLKPLIDAKRFSFEEAGEAHRRLESGEGKGKVSLER